ncbi:MAG: uroporphyrinogen decarboxylase family protein, partial [Oscillospiraceae bacterium]
MNKIERIRTVMNGGVPDRIPVMTHNFMMAAKESGFTMKQYRESPDIIVRVLTEACEKYDTDGILLDVDTALLASACGADTIFPDDIAGVVTDKQTRTIPELIDFIGKLELEKKPRIMMNLETIRKLSESGKKNGVFIRGNADQGSFSLACLLVGMNDFLMDLLDEDCEEDLLKLMESTYGVALKMHRLCFKAGAHCTSYGNSSEGCSVV